MNEQPAEWMPREQWERLVQGTDCPLCQECSSEMSYSPHGYTVATLRISQLRLAMNQFVAGYCVLICTQHVQEPYHLSPQDQAVFFEDMMHAAQALEQVFHPVKMNFELLGNCVPHLHAHLVPRYYGDSAPGRPINPGAQMIQLTPEAYAERVALLQDALQHSTSRKDGDTGGASHNA
jgi:diadenosine tetraphosphate (Ap4A) HIT family hydrolase